MVVVRVVVVRTQNFLSRAARGSGTRGCGARGSIRTQNFLSPAARGSAARRSGTNAKFSYVQPRMVLLRKQNFLNPGSRVSGTRGRGTKANFSKSSSAS